MEDFGTARAGASEYVQFWTAGQQAKGEFHCAECGYGVTIVRTLPVCPMGGGGSWGQAPGSPIARRRMRVWRDDRADAARLPDVWGWVVGAVHVEPVLARATSPLDAPR